MDKGQRSQPVVDPAGMAFGALNESRSSRARQGPAQNTHDFSNKDKRYSDNYMNYNH